MSRIWRNSARRLAALSCRFAGFLTQVTTFVIDHAITKWQSARDAGAGTCPETRERTQACLSAKRALDSVTLFLARPSTCDWHRGAIVPYGHKVHS
jgi:hypothetical protein